MFRSTIIFIRGAAYLLLGVALMAPLAVADSITAPVQIANSNASDGPTLGIPRWKAYMSETDPNQFWVSYANGGTSLGNITYTTDAGQSWSSSVIQVDATGWLDMHLSMFGRNGNLYFTWPGNSAIMFRKFSPPAHSNTDRGPLVSIAGTSASHRSNLMVQPNGRIWLFTRLSYASMSENVLYNYSDNEGSTWTHGVAYAANSNSVRIGSMPYAGGNPALIVLYLDDARGFQYYHWNGSSFVERSDHAVYAANMGQTRVFTHNVVRDSVFHLIFGVGTSLHHVWKNYNGGSGAWNHQIIDNSATTVENEWFPTSTTRGDDLYLFYCKKSSTDDASSRIYYKKWSQLTRTWSSPILISTAPGNTYDRDPNTCFQVPANASYIPVVWRSGTGGYPIYFSKIIVSLDNVPPATVQDLSMAPGQSNGEVLLSWTAPGDDGSAGLAAAYDIRYAEFSLVTGQWQNASPIVDPPSPKPAGQRDSCVVTGLSPGTTYYLALKTVDSTSNWSNVSNVVAYTTPTDIPDVENGDGLPRVTGIANNSPNPFSGATNIRFSLAVRSHVAITVYDLLGRKVVDLLDRTMPAGNYSAHWDGRDAGGNRVATGIYFSRLTTEDKTSTHSMMLIR